MLQQPASSFSWHPRRASTALWNPASISSWQPCHACRPLGQPPSSFRRRPCHDPAALQQHSNACCLPVWRRQSGAVCASRPAPVSIQGCGALIGGHRPHPPHCKQATRCLAVCSEGHADISKQHGRLRTIQPSSWAASTAWCICRAPDYCWSSLGWPRQLSRTRQHGRAGWALGKIPLQSPAWCTWAAGSQPGHTRAGHQAEATRHAICTPGCPAPQGGLPWHSQDRQRQPARPSSWTSLRR